eukprot:Sdes_comp9106_c0_seq1m568
MKNWFSLLSFKVSIVFYFTTSILSFLNQPLGMMYFLSSVLMNWIGFLAFTKVNNLEAIQLLIFIYTSTLITDVVVLSCNSNQNYFSDTSSVQFSVSLVIINLILRPVYLFLFYKEYLRRGGEFSFRISLNVGKMSDGMMRNNKNSHPNIKPQQDALNQVKIFDPKNDMSETDISSSPAMIGSSDSRSGIRPEGVLSRRNLTTASDMVFNTYSEFKTINSEGCPTNSINSPSVVSPSQSNISEIHRKSVHNLSFETSPRELSHHDLENMQNVLNV